MGCKNHLLYPRLAFSIMIRDGEVVRQTCRQVTGRREKRKKKGDSSLNGNVKPHKTNRHFLESKSCVQWRWWDEETSEVERVSWQQKNSSHKGNEKSTGNSRQSFTGGKQYVMWKRWNCRRKGRGGDDTWKTWYFLTHHKMGAKIHALHYRQAFSSEVKISGVEAWERDTGREVPSTGRRLISREEIGNCTQPTANILRGWERAKRSLFCFINK